MVNESLPSQACVLRSIFTPMVRTTDGVLHLELITGLTKMQYALSQQMAQRLQCNEGLCRANAVFNFRAISLRLRETRKHIKFKDDPV